MKKICLLICLLYVCSLAYSQSKTDDINFDFVRAQVKSKARLFCDYVMKVGTSPGQPGAVPDREKRKIIEYLVRDLFLQPYSERYMITTNGVNGQFKRQIDMDNYFRNLRRQSTSGLNTERKYELRYVGFVSNGDKKGFTFKRYLSDGSELWSATIRIKQFYHKINFSAKSPESRCSEATEVDYKDFTVYLVIKPNGKKGVYLGDVERALRQ